MERYHHPERFKAEIIEEQEGKDRAEYVRSCLRALGKALEMESGSGFTYRQLARARQFYRLYPKVSAVRTLFNWLQYKLLIHIDDSEKREYYELEAVANNWNGRELERQINSGLYERLLLSNDKESVLICAVVGIVCRMCGHNLGTNHK
ncbi:MAG: DUF1016 N-terminal domain-containing protein [Rikenellaceae bacterium]